MSGEQLAAIELEHRLAKAESEIKSLSACIVGLADALAEIKRLDTDATFKDRVFGCGLIAFETLTEHAEVIKKARGE